MFEKPEKGWQQERTRKKTHTIYCNTSVSRIANSSFLLLETAVRSERAGWKMWDPCATIESQIFSPPARPHSINKHFVSRSNLKLFIVDFHCVIKTTVNRFPKTICSHLGLYLYSFWSQSVEAVHDESHHIACGRTCFCRAIRLFPVPH